MPTVIAFPRNPQYLLEHSAFEKDPMPYIKKTLPNGVRLLMEPVRGVRSASVGMWMEVGSRDEMPSESGISHFIEHMFFKGSARHDAFEINDAMNFLGGHFNAFTSQEAICLHARLIDEQLAQGIDLLAEVLLTPQLPAEEIERERMVILEELKMIEDTPDDLVMDVFHEVMWADDPVGRPIVGSADTVGRFKREDLRAYMEREFSPERLIISVAGSFDRKAVETQVRRLFADLEHREAPPRTAQPPKATFQFSHRIKDVEQVQFCFGGLAPSRADELRYNFAVLNSIYGGGMSSRIFREVREKRGLAYSIGSFSVSMRNTGAFAISGGTSPSALEPVLKLCRREARDLVKNGPSEQELSLAKQQLRASVLFSLEHTGSRMSQLAEQEMYLGRQTSVDETLRRLDAVTARDVQETAAMFYDKAKLAVALVGPAISKPPIQRF